MYPTTKTYSKEYRELDKSKVVIIKDLSLSIVSYLEAIIKDRNRALEGISSVDSNSYETEHNNWNIKLKGDGFYVDEFIKIADALMLYRYGERVKVNGWPIGNLEQL